MVGVSGEEYLNSFRFKSLEHFFEISTLSYIFKRVLNKRWKERTEVSNEVYLLVRIVYIRPVPVHMSSYVFPHLPMIKFYFAFFLPSPVAYLQLNCLGIENGQIGVEEADHRLVVFILQHLQIEVSPSALLPIQLSDLFLTQLLIAVVSAKDLVFLA